MWGSAAPSTARASPAWSGEEELVCEVLGRETGEESAQSSGEVAGDATSSDDDTGMRSSRLQPSSMQALEVHAVMRQQHAGAIGGEGQLFLIRSAEPSGVAGRRDRKASCAEHRREYQGNVLVAVECWGAVRHPDA